MGCWNATCGISHLPITYGDRVKCIILIENQYKSRTDFSDKCYVHDVMVPLFFMLSGTNDDNGSLMTVDDDWNSRYCLHKMNEWIRKERISINNNYDSSTSFSAIEDMVLEISKGGVCYEEHGVENVTNDVVLYPAGNGYKKLSISRFVILEYVFDKLIDGFTKKDDQRIKLWSDLNIDTAKMVMRLDVTRSSSFNHYVNEMDDENRKQIIDGIQMMNITEHMMDNLRVGYIPQVGAGSQNLDWEFHGMLCKIASEYVDSKIEEERKLNEEEERQCDE